MVAFLLAEQGAERRHDNPAPPVTDGGDSGQTPRPAPPLPRIDEALGAKGLEAFVAACAAQGEAAVPGLLRALAEGKDRQVEPRWIFVAGGTRGYPTLRSAYIAALRAIPGDASTAALAQVMADTRSVEETCLLGLALAERRETSFVPTLLERIPAEPAPALLPVQWQMVELAARVDPGETARRLEATAPRGEDGSDPQVFARALGALPLAAATGSGRALLIDPDVTPRAKSRYLRSLLDRPEMEVLHVVEEVAGLGQLTDELKTDLAYAAVESDAFRLDGIAHETALAQGDHVTAKAASDRFRLRTEQTTRLMSAVLGIDVATSDDPRAQSLRRKLEAHEKHFEGAR